MLSLAEDTRESARALWSEVFAEWLALGPPFDHAYAVLCAAWTLGADGVDEQEVASARSSLAGLGARPMLRLYDEAGL